VDLCQCSEQVEADFDVCWNCGTSQDGTPDPDFKTVSEFQESGLAAEKTLSNEQLLSQQFTCPRCRRREAVVRQIRMQPAELLAIFPLDLLAVSCTGCGLTELYNPDAVEGRSFHDAVNGLFDAGR